MPYKIMTPEIREIQRLKVKQWRLNNPDKVRLQNQNKKRSRSFESHERELLRMHRNYEFVKEYRMFQRAIPAFLTA